MRSFCSLFQQMLEFFPRGEFDRAVRDTGTEFHCRGFTSWEHFVSMLFCQVSHSLSLRDICDGLNSLQGKRNHLGIDTPRKSTLSYANTHRSPALFELMFHSLVARAQSDLGMRHRFRFRNKLLTLDTSTIVLCAEVFDWAKYMTTKGAVKLHVLLDNDGMLPVFCNVTTGKVSDIQIARTLQLPAGTILVCDRGYVDFPWFHRLTRQGVFFVSRLRTSDPVKVIDQKPVSGDVLRDERVEVGVKRRDGFGPLILRRVVVLDEEGNEFQIITNNTKLAASTISAIYRERWKIETFFRTIKQNLKIKTFVGTSANALQTQVWSALIALVLLKYLQMKARSGWSFSRLVSLVRLHLLSYKDLWSWVDDPFGEIEESPPPQLQLTFGQQTTM